ncbi:heterokaryon incompatibility protein-domain-containing protein [Xylariaceae sp. FL0255]|nr:heterokaryon incompatibility protein-domain-containing protein [Xylariaceae sp. FL0255]
MRLLNVETLKLETFQSSRYSSDVPKYAILSHTWGENEILFCHIESLNKSQLENMKSYSKVRSSCFQARMDGFTHIWIDSCCIERSSSAELSEAINSMWAWYRESAVCYVFLADVKKGDEQALCKSRWFSRGWTLQELIAPESVRFFDKDWQEINNRLDMSPLLSKITGIEQLVLSRHVGKHDPETLMDGPDCVVCGQDMRLEVIMQDISVATKMSWSSQRNTTRDEDS